MNAAPKLTGLSSCAGCAAKLGQEALQQVLQFLPALPRDPNLLVGSASADDAAVYRLTRDTALVQTVDFFTPIVDDPFAFGQIAAANAISDVYAMGGRPLTALSLVGMPTDILSPRTIAEILRGGQLKAAEAGCQVVGGHTIRLPEPVYGLAVTGLVSPRRVMANTQAAEGDFLVLTKPLGTGVITTAIKRDIGSPGLQQKAITLMSTLNSVGYDLAQKQWVTAATDVTGFGLLGHLANICRGSRVSAQLDPARIPVISPEVLKLIEQDCIPGGSRKNLETANKWTNWGDTEPPLGHVVTDAQTSGGLLLCVRPALLERVLDFLSHAHTHCAAVLGRLHARRGATLITFHPQVFPAQHANGNHRTRSPRPEPRHARPSEPAVAACR